jgi:hypothetical protein
VVSVFIGVFILTEGQGVQIVWPGDTPPDSSNSPNSPKTPAARYDVQIHLLEGERYLFSVSEETSVERFRAISTAFWAIPDNANNATAEVCKSLLLPPLSLSLSHTLTHSLILFLSLSDSHFLSISLTHILSSRSTFSLVLSHIPLLLS